MTATDLADFSTVELVAAYRAGTVSPVEAIRAVLARAAAWEPRLGALFAVDEAGALATAAESEARWRQGAVLGPIDGVPITIKDLIATKGVAVPVGTAASDMNPAEEDAPPAARVPTAR